MLSTAMQEALNEQVSREASSAYLYLSMAAYYESANLPGFAHWMRLQSQEEWGHALKLFEYLNNRGGKVVLQAIPQPQSDFASALDAFEKALEHEQKVTASIHRIYALALQENDYATQVELQWYIKEQVEEEKNAGQIVDRLKSTSGSGSAIYVIDHHLAKRA